MPEVNIHFQEGFDDDTAEVRAGATCLLNLAHLRTSKLVGLAEAKSVELPDGVVELEIKLPERNIKQHLQVDTGKIRNLGVSLESDGLVVTQSEREFGYA